MKQPALRERQLCGMLQRCSVPRWVTTGKQVKHRAVVFLAPVQRISYFINCGLLYLQPRLGQTVGAGSISNFPPATSLTYPALSLLAAALSPCSQVVPIPSQLHFQNNSGFSQLLLSMAQGHLVTNRKERNKSDESLYDHQ